MPPKPAGKTPPGKGAAAGGRGAGPAATRQRPQPAATGPSRRAPPTSSTGAAATKRGGPVGGAAAARRPVGPPGKGKATPTGKGGKVAAPVKGDTKAPPKKPAWTKEDEAARKIQTSFRGHRCRKLLVELKKKQVEYDQLMEKLQREAYVQLVKMERERAEKEYEREEAERRRRREHQKRVKRMLEAAFDGDCQEIRKVLKEVAELHGDAGDAVVARYQYKLVECSDPNDNTPLSEAGAGGDPEAIRLLVGLGAEPNTKGQYGRMPLYRAAFAGHLEAVKVLLECGADPRIYADDGAIPEQVSAQPAVEECLKTWAIAETERLLVGLDEARQQRAANESKLRQAEEDKIMVEIKEAEKEHSARQKQLSKAHKELNKRIYEHDKCVSLKPDITLAAIHDAEEFLEESKGLAEKARERLQQAKLKLRLKQKEYQDVTGEDEAEKADVVINIRELDDVLMKDVGNRIEASGKWPLIIDPSKQVSTFLRYRDTNFINACSPRDLEPERLRMSLLGAIRYGKFAVLDLLDVEDLWPAVQLKFDSIQNNLLQDIMSKEILKDEKYLSLAKPSDGEEYSRKMFIGSRIDRFKLVIVSHLFSPPEELTSQCYVIRIHLPQETF